MSEISTLYARLLMRELESDGIPLTPFLARLGLRQELLWERETMPAGDLRGLLSFALVASGDRGLGLRMGSHCQPSMLGEIGISSLAAPNLLESLRTCVDCSQLYGQYMSLAIRTDNQTIALIIEGDAQVGLTYRSYVEMTMLAIQRIIEACLLRPLAEGSCHFAFSEPEYADRYTRYFHSPVNFNADSNRLEVPLKLGVTVSPTANPIIREQSQTRYKKQLRALARENGTPYTQHVIRRLWGAPPPAPGQRDIAAELQMTERTLVRKLQAEGTQYRSLSQQVLRERAEFSLRETDTKVELLSTQLGYRDSANFRRAFRRWNGESPQQYRKRLRSA